MSYIVSSPYPRTHPLPPGISTAYALEHTPNVILPNVANATLTRFLGR